MTDNKKCKTCPNKFGLNLCNQPYALCSKADCIFNKKKNTYKCYCENFNGCSLTAKKMF